MSPHYMSRIQRYYAKRQQNADRVGTSDTPLLPVGTRVSHASIPTHPNVAKVTRWINNTYFQSPGHPSYEAGFVIPFSYYCLEGGFSSRDYTHETSWVNANRSLTGAQLYTSPRRYIDRLPECGSDDIWRPGTFGPNDRCREELVPDISSERAEDLILDRMQDDINIHWSRGVLEPIFDEIRYAGVRHLRDEGFVADLKERASYAAKKQHSKIVNFLHHVVGSDLLADIANDCIDADESARSRVQSLVYLNLAILSDSGDFVISRA